MKSARLPSAPERQRHTTLPNLTKRDLVLRISNETGLVQRAVSEIIDRILDHLVNDLSEGKTVEFRNFGIFEVKFRKARLGRNPQSPAQAIPIPPRAAVKFKPGKEMKARVLELAHDLLKKGL